jgi:hypothetical protein
MGAQSTTQSFASPPLHTGSLVNTIFPELIAIYATIAVLENVVTIELRNYAKKFYECGDFRANSFQKLIYFTYSKTHNHCLHRKEEIR